MPEVTLAGTGGMLPLTYRWLTNLYYQQNGHAVLIDCGEGTQIALTAAECRHSKIDVILITHTHADHVSGLPGLLLSIGNSGRTEPLDIYLPEGKTKIVKGLLNICDRLPYLVRFNELPLDCGCTFELPQIDPLLRVSTLPLCHSTHCLGYSLTLTRRQEFQPEKAKELGVPLKMWRVLHGGESVTLDDGRVITPDMVTLANRRPIKVTYVTDTLPIAAIADFARGSQLFICEGMYGEPEKKADMNSKKHMLMQDACRLASAAEVKSLWLTHYSPACPAPWVFKDELRRIFPNVTISKDGQKTEIKE